MIFWKKQNIPGRSDMLSLAIQVLVWVSVLTEVLSQHPFSEEVIRRVIQRLGNTLAELWVPSGWWDGEKKGQQRCSPYSNVWACKSACACFRDWIFASWSNGHRLNLMVISEKLYKTVQDGVGGVGDLNCWLLCSCPSLYDVENHGIV